MDPGISIGDHPLHLARSGSSGRAGDGGPRRQRGTVPHRDARVHDFYDRSAIRVFSREFMAVAVLPLLCGHCDRHCHW